MSHDTVKGLHQRLAALESINFNGNRVRRLEVTRTTHVTRYTQFNRCSQEGLTQ